MKQYTITKQELKDYENDTSFVSNINNSKVDIVVVDTNGIKDDNLTKALKRLVDINIERENLLKILLD